MVEYLESVHQGEFITGTMESVGNRLDKLKDEDPSHTCPTESLPTPPPPKCAEAHASSEEMENCAACASYSKWLCQCHNEINEILFRSNRHSCREK